MSLLSFQETLEKLGVSESELRDLVKEKKLQVFATGKGSGVDSLRFKSDDLDAFAESAAPIEEEVIPDPIEENALPEIELPDDVDEDSSFDLDIPNDPDFNDLEMDEKDSLEEEEEEIPVHEPNLSLEPDFSDEVTTVSPESSAPDIMNEPADITFDLSDSEDLGDSSGEDQAEKTAIQAPDLGGSGDTLSFEMPDTLSLPEEDLTLEEVGDETLSGDNTQTLSGVGGGELNLGDEIDEDEDEDEDEESASSYPMTKIVNEREVGLGWPLTSILTFFMIGFVGFMCYGLILSFMSSDGFNEPDSFFANVTQFVKDNIGIPD